MKIVGKLICLLLVSSMLLSVLPMAAWAEDGQPCPECGQEECTCQPEGEDPTPCEKCGKSPCECEPEGENPTPCEKCGKTPCECLPEGEDPAPCEKCGKTPCECQPEGEEPTPCAKCGEADCICCPKCNGTTQNHDADCPTLQDEPQPVADGGQELVVKEYINGPFGGLQDDDKKGETIDLFVLGDIGLYVTLEGQEVDISTLSVSPAEYVYMNKASTTDENGTLNYIVLMGLKKGTADLYYTDPQTKAQQKLVTIDITTLAPWYEPGAFMCLENGGLTNTIQQQNGHTSTKRIGIIEKEQFRLIDTAKLYTTSDNIKLEQNGNECKITVLAETVGGYICYDENGKTYRIEVKSNDAVSVLEENPKLILKMADGLHSAYEMGAGESMEVAFCKGSTGAAVPITEKVTSKNPDILDVTYDQATGKYTLTAKKAGEATLTAGTLTCTVDVTALSVGKGKLLAGSQSYLNIASGNSVSSVKFYFGTSESDKQEVADSDLKWDSNITLTKVADGSYTVTVTSGTGGLIWYVKDGIQYTIPVSTGSGDAVGSTITIGGVTYSTGELTKEVLSSAAYFRDVYTEKDQEAGYSRQIVLAAMRGNEVATEAYKNISGVTFEMVGCWQESNANASTNATIQTSVSRPVIPGKNCYTWGTTVSAPARKGFRATIAMSFTLKESDGTSRRITLQCQCSYIGTEGNIIVHADELNTAAKLNNVLQSEAAFAAWLLAPGGQTMVEGDANRYQAGACVTMYLPAVTYEDVIVVNTGNKGTLELVGATEGGKTVLPGLDNRGGLRKVEFIDFVAVRGKTMTYGGETFTCGILSSGSNVEYLRKCSFTGFDYGVYSVGNGLVGGGVNNSFTNCYYAIYVANHQVTTTTSQDADYGGYTFTNNVYAIRVDSRPGGTSAYRFRVHDCTFIHNHREFWIKPSGDYYFFRNYFGGYWHEDGGHCGNWNHFVNRKPEFDTWDQGYQGHGGHRPGRYVKESDARIIITASRKDIADSGIYWIYGREDQNNRIPQGEKLPIAEESIKALDQDTKVYVVKEDGTESAVINFRGKEG